MIILYIYIYIKQQLIYIIRSIGLFIGDFRWTMAYVFSSMEAGCVGTILAGIVIILLLYADDIVLQARCPSDLDKQLRLLKDFCSTMGMPINTNKTKIMIIKSKKGTYANFVYENNNSEEVSSYKYLGIDIHKTLNWNYSIK